MHKKILNLGILAHVDAGKTSLTERLLFDNGATTHLGSVDAGTTKTDSGEIERERGITIRAAVASFLSGNLQVNVVDTPGHPDFIAEVERALSVLDGAVLVLSAVEGVQPQTRVLMRSLRRLKLPTLLFINKIDRMGARTDSLLDDIRKKLVPLIVPMSSVQDAGKQEAKAARIPLEDQQNRMTIAEILAENDDGILTQIVDGLLPSPNATLSLLIKQTAAGIVYPVFFGSALTGEGTAALTEGIKIFLPSASIDSEGEPRGTVFAIERATGKEKIAYLRLFSGELRERQRITFRRMEEGGRVNEVSGKIAKLEIIGENLSILRVDGGASHNQDSQQRPRTEHKLTAGSIGKIRGIPQIRVGDYLGEKDPLTLQPNFSPPSLMVLVRARYPEQQVRLHSALTSLADEDPLIQTRVVGNGAISVLLYGAVQQEVITERLLRDFGVEPVFEDIKPVYFERPVGIAEAIREFNPRDPDEYWWATIGLRVEPSRIGTGINFIQEVKSGLMPLAYYRAIEASVYQTLQQGLYGWPVTDCTVSLIQLSFEAPMCTAATFRNLTWIVLMRALQVAGTKVHEPYQSLEVEVPSEAVNSVISHLSALGGTITQAVDKGVLWSVTAELAVKLIQEFMAALPGLSHGQGAVWSQPSSDRPVHGDVPLQERFDDNLVKYDEYMSDDKFFTVNLLKRD